MARVPLPESKLRARKRRRRVLFVVGTVVVLGALAGLSAWVSHASFLRASTILVSGNRTFASSTMMHFIEEKLQGAYLGLYPRDNILLYPQEEIASGLLKKFPVLRTASVRAENFTTLRAVVVERDAKALWCGSTPSAPEPCFFLDDEGLVYVRAPEFSNPVYKRYFGALEQTPFPKRYLPSDDFRQLFALIDAIAAQAPEEEITSVAVDRENDVRVRFAGGFMLIFHLGDEGGDIYERYMLALQAEPFAGRSIHEFEYLDLRFGDKLYYKEKNQ